MSKHLDNFKNAVVNEIEQTSTNDCLEVKPFNTWLDEAKQRPIPRMLFSKLWYENELGILFSDSNLGKSILAIQIGNSISKGNPISGFELETTPLKTLYLDFELTDKQLERRYSENYENHYVFNDNFLRAELKIGLQLPSEFASLEDYLCHSIESKIKSSGINVLIIDNITALRSETEKSKDALVLMNVLNNLKKQYNISILVLAHTPKRDRSKPISKNDLSGSRMLMNFCDSAFAIGEDITNPDQRYLKQVKQRNTECVYHEDNVVICKVVKDSNFLGFEHIGYGTEYEHLVSKTPAESIERNQKIIDFKQQGRNNCEIARELNISEGTVRNIWGKK